MAQNAKQKSGDHAEVELFHGGLVVTLVNAQTQILPGFIADDRPYAIGETNARYAIHIVNKSDYSFEVVASVDGLSVIDGRRNPRLEPGRVLQALCPVLAFASAMLEMPWSLSTPAFECRQVATWGWWAPPGSERIAAKLSRAGARNGVCSCGCCRVRHAGPWDIDTLEGHRLRAQAP